MTGPFRFFLIAGEPSGDKLGAALMAGLKKEVSEGLEFSGVGGPLMEEQGLKSLFPMSDLSIMGVVEILPKIPQLLSRIKQTAQAAEQMHPDAVITIDSPDFCLRVAKKFKAAVPDTKIIHYVAPSVWAWRPERATKMAKLVDHVLALLPFEPPFMQDAGMTCDFVGHPAVGEPRASEGEKAAVLAELGLDPAYPIMTVLPGSRSGEIHRLSGIFADTVQRVKQALPDIQIVIPAAQAVAREMEEVTANWIVKPRILDPRGKSTDQAEISKRAVFALSDVALAASGTVSLELAHEECPMVIAYKANWMTTRMVKKLALIDTATLVNIVTDTRHVPEFLFENCDPDLIAPALIELLSDKQARDNQADACRATMALLGYGNEDPGLKAAKSVLNAIR